MLTPSSKDRGRDSLPPIQILIYPNY